MAQVEQVAGSCQHGNEHSVSTKREEISLLAPQERQCYGNVKIPFYQQMHFLLNI